MSASTNDMEKGNDTAAKFERSTVDASRQFTVQNGGGYGIRRIGNPGPLGLMAFASTTLVLSLYNVQARHINTPNVVVGLALAFGGLAQLLAGQWEFVCGNTFGATAFSSYGAFWLSFALIFWPGSGILDAYQGPKKSQLHDALAIYLITWFVVTFIFLIAVLRTHLAFIALFFFLDVTFIVLAAGEFVESPMTTKAGGGLGIVTALIAYYIAASGLITKETAFVSLPLVHFHSE